MTVSWTDDQPLESEADVTRRELDAAVPKEAAT